MRVLFARMATAQGPAGALLVTTGILLRFGAWAALMSLGAFMLADEFLRSRS